MVVIFKGCLGNYRLATIVIILVIINLIVIRTTIIYRYVSQC